MTTSSNTPASSGLPELPPDTVGTPAFVIYEDRVLHNLKQTVAAAGGWDRLMPHLKTHRAPWIVRLLLQQGITSFKAATVAEVEMALEAGARTVFWAYPTASRNNIGRFIACARKWPNSKLMGAVDTAEALGMWQQQLTPQDANVRLLVDLDPGLRRTGVPMNEAALSLARAAAKVGRFDGWHIYDGHVKGTRDERQAQVNEIAGKVRGLMDALRAEGIESIAVAGGSYTFDLWPSDVAPHVSPGSWTYSSAQHDIELAHLGWLPAAFVLATVASTRDGTVTFDAGCKAISPDKPLASRFRWDGEIILMNEEHTVARGSGAVGERVLLMPQHACTTAYLYDAALVRTVDGQWETRPQMGNRR